MNELTLPEAFVANMAEQLKDELPAFLACYREPPRRGIRLNGLKPPADRSALPGIGEPIPWAEDAFFLAGDSPAGLHPLHEAGACYIQEPSAMIPASVLRPRPGERVLDLCAAPGGKTTQMAAMMGGQGLLVCNEPVRSRAQVLSRNTERMGVVNAVVLSAWPEELAGRFPAAFDAVMVDAPCSGEGMFRRVPESRGEWTPQAPAGCAQRQAGILDAAARMVRPGGRLVYATCTLNPTENGDQVKAFLLRHPDFSLQPFALPGVEAAEGMFTCYPHRMPGEGQFCALLVRSGNEPGRFPAGRLPAPDRAQRQALVEALPEAPVPDGLFGENLISLGEIPELRGLQVLRCGLHLGTMRSGRFLPDHAWAVSSLPPACPRTAVTEEEARRFQAGETLSVPSAVPGGWVLPTLSGLALGWGKVTGGILKNHYPKGLRRPLP